MLKRSRLWRLSEFIGSRTFAALPKLTAVGTIAFAAGPAAAEVCGQLAGVKGPGVEILRVQPAGTGEQVRYGMRIEEGKGVPVECDDVILAGRDSNAKIIIANGKLSLGPDSRIEIAQHVKSGAASGLAKVSLVNLTYGKMRALIQKRAPVPPTSTLPAKAGEPAPVEFRVRTFSAVAGVRGTDFFTSYDPNSGRTEQATLEGAVEVQQTGTKQSVLVSSGKQVAVDPPPAAALPPLEVVPIRDSLRNEMRVASAIVRGDQDFAHTKAVEILGQPSTWTLEREKIPAKHDEIKNEF